MDSIRRYIPPGASFDSETSAILAGVFDRICAQLQLGPDDPLREAFALKIISAAAMGERDPMCFTNERSRDPFLNANDLSRTIQAAPRTIAT
jgi:hypothetical protein